MKRIFCTVLTLLLCAVLCTAAFANGGASLYIGDSEWEDDSILPFIESDGKKLVPAIAIAKLDGVTLTMSESLGSLLLVRGKGYISYNLQNGSYMTPEKSENASIYSYGGTIYIEPAPACQALGLIFETEFASDGYLTARIRSEEHTTPFSALLSNRTASESELPFLYNPTGKTVAGLFMYPYLITPTAANVSAIIPLVAARSVTFAISPHDISAYIEVLPAIYANGHSVAYYMSEESKSSPDEFAAAMAAANELLFAAVGKTSRIYVSSSSSEEMPDIDGFFKKGCRMNLVANDLLNSRVVSLTLSDLPLHSFYNFSLASDNASRANYFEFFRKFDKYDDMRSMSANEATASD